MDKPDNVEITDPVAACSAHELDVTVVIVDKDENRRAIKNMGANDGRLVLSVGIAREVDH